MRIDHIAIWVEDLEKMKEFYINYFSMKCGEIYINEKKQFSSYFLSFDNCSRIELMHRPDILKSSDSNSISIGLTHIAISLGSRKSVDLLTEIVRKDGWTISGEPRITGDGFYESVILDPEGNSIEITE